MIHNTEIYRKAQKIINYLSFIKNESKDSTFQIDEDFRDIMDYLEKLERDNFGLHAYKKHQEEKEAKTYGRNARTTPWSRGSLLTKRSKKE